MVIRKRAELDTVNPPGQVTWPFPAALHKPVHGGYPGDVNPISLAATEHNEDESNVVMMASFFKDKAE